jgi:RNA polymerase sigma factor (sigma-70 family)
MADDAKLNTGSDDRTLDAQALENWENEGGCPGFADERSSPVAANEQDEYIGEHHNDVVLKGVDTLENCDHLITAEYLIEHKAEFMRPWLKTYSPDVVADAFSALCLDQASGKLRYNSTKVAIHGNRMATLVHSAIHHKIVDGLRKTHRHLFAEGYNVGGTPTAAPTVEEVLGREELRRLVHAAVNALSLPARELVTLHYFEDMSFTEIAQKTGRSETAIKSCLYRARVALRDMLARHVNPACRRAMKGSSK